MPCISNNEGLLKNYHRVLMDEFTFRPAIRDISDMRITR